VLKEHKLPPRQKCQPTVIWDSNLDFWINPEGSKMLCIHYLVRASFRRVSWKSAGDYEKC